MHIYYTTLEQCNKPYTEFDVYPINPKPEEMLRLVERQEARKLAEKADRKSKKKSSRSHHHHHDRDGVVDGDEPDEVENAEATGSKRKHSNGTAEHAVKRTTATTTTTKFKGISESAQKSIPLILQAKETSDAIKSIYTSSSKEDPSKQSWLTKGTFNRYVA